MPINTRSMRKDVKQSPAKSSALKPDLRTIVNAKPPKGPSRTKKTTGDPQPGSSKRMVMDMMQASSEMSGTKNPRQFDGFSSARSKPNLKDVYKNKTTEENHGKKKNPASLKVEFVELSNYFSSALSKRREFYNLFKDAEDEFQKDYEFGKKLIEQKTNISQLPLCHTPLGKKLYATLNASSALRPNSKDISAETFKKPKMPTFSPVSKAQKRLRSPEENSTISRTIDKLPPSFEFGIGSPGKKKKLIMENVALNTLDEEPIIPLTDVPYIQNKVKNVEPATAILDATYVYKKPENVEPAIAFVDATYIQNKPKNVEPATALADATYIQKKPGHLEPVTAPADSTYIQKKPENVQPTTALADATYIQKKPGNLGSAPALADATHIQKKPGNVESAPALADATYIQKKPGNLESAPALADATYIQKKPGNLGSAPALADATYIQKKPGNLESAPALADATYIQKKPGNIESVSALADATYVQKKLANVEQTAIPSNATVDLSDSASASVSVELFSDEDLKADMSKDIETEHGHFPPKNFIQDKKSEDSNSTSSSVSALVERFELKKSKMTKNPKTVPTALPNTKAHEVASSNEEAKLMVKEALEDNTAFIMESSVVESPIEKILARDRSESAAAKKNSLQQGELQKEALSKANATFTKAVPYKMPSVDQTFVVNANKLSVVDGDDSDSDVSPFSPPVADKTYVKDVKKILAAKKSPPRVLELPKKGSSSKSSKSGKSTSSSSSGSMKSAVSQPSLTNMLPFTKMGLKNTGVTGSAGTVYEKQKGGTAKEAESAFKKRLIEKEEDAAKRKLEIDQRKMEMQKKKNEEWKRKAEKMKADEKKLGPMPASAKVQFAGHSSQAPTKGATLNQNPKLLKPMTLFKPSGGACPSAFPSKFNNKLLMPPSDVHARNYEEPSRDDSYRTADGCSFLDMTNDVDPDNNYDITRYEDIDEECKHRENKSIPDWARGENITFALFKQIPYDNLELAFFSKADSKYRLFRNTNGGK